MRNRIFVICCYTLCLLLCLSYHTESKRLRYKMLENVPLPVILMEEGELEHTSRNLTNCKNGFKCPIDGAICCDGGEVCCLYGCEATQPVSCKANDFPSVLSTVHDHSEERAKQEEHLKIWRLAVEQRKAAQDKELSVKTVNEATEKKIASAQEQDSKRTQQRKEIEITKSEAKEETHKTLEEEGEKREEASKQSQRKVSLRNRFRSYGRGYRGPTYSRLGSLCMVSGVIAGPQQNGVVAQLPSQCRPAQKLAFDVHISRCDTARYDVLTTGEVVWRAGAFRVGMASAWLALDGISFPVIGSQTFNVPLSPPWVNFDQDDYQGAIYTESTGLCALSGMIRTLDWHAGAMQNPVFKIGPECKPDKRLTFLVNHDEVSFRFDILPNGEGRIVDGPKRHAWLSLSGLIFHTKCSNILELKNGWRVYNNDVRVPCYKKSGSLCVFSGLAKATNGFHSSIAVVPPECRPEMRLIFNLAAPGGAQRLDVYPDGNIVWIDGRKGWVSFDGIRYMVKL